MPGKKEIFVKYDTIYVLHKQGANSHYMALDHLLAENAVELKYREFSVFTKIFKALRKFDLKALKKQFINSFFLFNLLFTRDKKIVLGIAPFDHKLIFLLKLLQRHQVYYHTSWTCWDKSFHPKRKKNSPRVFENWRFFLEEKTRHIFSVSQKGKTELLSNYDIPSGKISVVNHSLPKQFATTSEISKKENSFLYVGRLVPQKGLIELLEFFKKQSEATFTIIGSGELQPKIQKYSEEFTNIIYRDYLTDKSELKKEFAQNEYLVLNSKRKQNWEELFGMVLIEGMSQGTIPVATDHSGPEEIIDLSTGFLCKEGNITEILSFLIKNHFDKEMSQNAIIKSRKYLPESLAKNWQAVLT